MNIWVIDLILLSLFLWALLTTLNNRPLKKFKTRLVLIMLIGLIQQNCYAQDVWLQNFFSPNSGCELSNSELVNVLINNNSGSFIPANSISVSYEVDAGPTVSELLGVNLSGGASWNFTFSTAANLSGCGTHNLKVWVNLATDPNPLNDTLNWVVQNDCIIVPGSVISNSTVCEGLNGDILDLTGWTNGTIIDWQSSIDSGTSWTGIGNTTTSNPYSNIDTTTLYHVIFDGGFCPDDTSDFATITVQPFPIGGTISSSATHCIDNANGTLTLSGASGAVIFWQYSENNGASWVTLANSTNSQDYLGLTMDTWYRTSTDGLICPDVYSDTAVIIIDELTVPGTISAAATICEGSTVSLELQGQTGSVLDWESSEDLVVWTALGDTDPNYDSPPLTQTTYYRVHVQNGLCADMYSDTVTITVDPLPVGGIVNSSIAHCETSVSGTLNLVGSAGAINFWEYSTDGGSVWNTIANTTSSEAYSGLLTETWYRVEIEGGMCSDVYSDTAIISIDPLTVAGSLSMDYTICEGNTVSLILSGYTGQVLDWESSQDLTLWTPLSEFDGDYDSPPLFFTTYYRVHLQSGVCPDAYSDTLTIGVDNLVIGGSINSSMALCESFANDTLVLNGFIGSNPIWEQSTNNGISWSPASGVNDSLIFIGLTDTTWYRVFFEGDACPDAYSDTAVITLWEDSDAGILGFTSTICEGESVNMATLGSIGSNYYWESSEDLVTWNLIATDTIGQVVTPLVTTSYRVIVQNQGCAGDTTSVVLVTVNPLPIADAGIDVTITEFDTLQLNGSAAVNVLWTPAYNISDSMIIDPLVWPTVTTTYIYEVTSVDGCVNWSEVIVTVLPYIEPSINIRNVVTPNGDGFNDYWLITGIEDFPETEVHVFNLYGQEIFQSSDYQNDWGGTFKGNILPNGTYHYVVILKDSDDVIKGNLTILGNE